MYDLTALHKNMYSGEYCCAPIMLKTGFDLEGVENEQALQAVAGLCGGMKSGDACGVLTGACCMVSFLAPEDAGEIIPQLVTWFRETYNAEEGGSDCRNIRKTPEDMPKCQTAMERTYIKCMELLEEFGYEYE